jgi:AcrR family transcriptional regulator
MPDDHGGRGRPRLESTDQRIVEAALALLRSKGPGAVNIETVAARSGVARTTIYRRYGSRDELMTAILDRVIEPSAPAPDLPVPEKLRWLLERIGEVLGNGLGRGATASVLADGDPEFTRAIRARLDARLRSMTEMMDVDIAAGRLRPHIDPDTLLGILVGAYLAEVLRHGAPRSGWTDRTIELLIPALT